MWRTGAVISMMVEDIAGLRPRDREAGESGVESLSAELEALERASRRARLVVGVDVVGVLVLFLLRDPSHPFLPSGQTIETVFTFGVLAVAAHAGFRYSQLLFFRAIHRLAAELGERERA